MNLQLHDVQNPSIAYRDSLADDADKDAEAHSLILDNPPFAGSLDYGGPLKTSSKSSKPKRPGLLRRLCNRRWSLMDSDHGSWSAKAYV